MSEISIQVLNHSIILAKCFVANRNQTPSWTVHVQYQCQPRTIKNMIQFVDMVVSNIHTKLLITWLKRNASHRSSNVTELVEEYIKSLALHAHIIWDCSSIMLFFITTGNKNGKFDASANEFFFHQIRFHISKSLSITEFYFMRKRNEGRKRTNDDGIFAQA
jgi:hypothetical protein